MRCCTAGGFLPRGDTIDKNFYCETLRKLRQAIQNKHRGISTYRIVLFHDNARSHFEHVTQQVLQNLINVAKTLLLVISIFFESEIEPW